MNSLRTALIKHLVAFWAGVAFLNIGFMQSEVGMLHLKESKQLMQTLNNNFEEESESGSEPEEDPAKEALEITLFEHGNPLTGISFSTRKVNPFGALHLSPGYRSTFSPPPEFSYLNSLS